MLLCSLFVLGTFPISALADEQTEIDQGISDQNKKIDQLDKQKADAEKELKKIGNTIKEIQDKAKKLENDQILLSNDTKILNDEIDEVSTRIEKRNQTIQKQARSIQLEGKGTGVLEVILSSDSLTDAMNKMNAANRLVKANKELLEEQELDKKTLENKQASLEKKSKQLHVTLQELEKKKKELADQQMAQQILLNEIAASKETEVSKKEAFENTKNELLAKQTELRELEERLGQRAGSSDVSGMIDGILFTTNKELKPPLRGADAVKEAKKYLGVPYVWGGTTPNGFDCSGLVQYVYAANNVLLPRVTTSQEYVGEMIGLNQLEPGDLVFFGARGATDHVGLYIGEGKYIHAPEPGDFVKITSISAFTPSFGVRISE